METPDVTVCFIEMCVQLVDFDSHFCSFNRRFLSLRCFPQTSHFSLPCCCFASCLHFVFCLFGDSVFRRLFLSPPTRHRQLRAASSCREESWETKEITDRKLNHHEYLLTLWGRGWFDLHAQAWQPGGVYLRLWPLQCVCLKQCDTHTYTLSMWGGLMVGGLF